MFNELENDPRIGSRYQFWFFVYETGNPILYSAAKLRESLEKALARIDPDGTDSALRRMVLIGHSQGGLLVKLMAVDLESQIREAYLSRPLEDLRVSEDTRDVLRRTFTVRPLSFVHRVVFIATPQRGSYVSGKWLAHQLGRLVRLPGTLLRASREALTQLPALAASSEGRLGSVYAMTPGSPLIKLLAPAPLAPWVVSHSIIPVKGDGPVAQGDDGVVKYASAHIDGVESELVIRSGHSVQAHPEAIQEVRRILIEHAAQPD
jgi:pimeloyl-ACP methyl ester carboxylesterase